MAERCAKCSAEEGLGSELVEESTLLLGRQRLCPQCRQKHHERVGQTLNLLLIGLGLIGMAAAIWRGSALLDSMLVRCFLLILFQWLMVFPHELGHALMGRWMGFSNVRILVGHGRPIWTGNLFGFEWLINSKPAGGLTLMDVTQALPGRYVLMTAAGPAVSLVAMLVAYLVQPYSGWPSLGTVGGLFFWANAIVLIQNLVPHHFESAYGRLANDGMIILQMLFPRLAAANEAGTAKIRRVGQWSICVLLWLCAVILGLLVVFVLVYDGSKPMPWISRISLAAFFALLAFALVVITRRLISSESVKQREHDMRHTIKALVEASIFATDPKGIAQLGKEMVPQHPERWLAAVRPRLETAPSDPFLRTIAAEAEIFLKRYAEALDHLAKIDLTKLTPAGQCSVYANQLKALFYHEFPRAEAFCEQIVDSEFPTDLKVSLLDNFICLSLFDEKLPHLESLEKWARRAHELAPQQLTTRGTLGSVLVELGKDEEAEAHLIACLESPAFHDKAISSYYLARIRHAEDNTAEARRLLQQSLIYAELPWLRPRVDELLRKLDA